MIAAVTMVRDEADIIGPVVAHLLAEGVDHVIAADNLSVDETPDILRSFGPAVTVVDDHEPGYYQADKMTDLAQRAGRIGAEWVVPFDADEWWYSTTGLLAHTLRAADDADVLIAATYHHIPHPDDPVDTDPVRRMVHRMADAKPMSKVAFRFRPDATLHMGNHDVDWPGARRKTGVIEIREFQYRTFEQMARKVRNGKAAYDASDLHPTYGTHWRRMGAMTDEQLRVEWDNHYGAEGLVRDRAPGA